MTGINNAAMRRAYVTTITDHIEALRRFIDKYGTDEDRREAAAFRPDYGEEADDG